jgi:hypothetical protein
MREPEFDRDPNQGGFDPLGLSSALNRRAPTRRGQWEHLDFLENVHDRDPTADDIRTGLQDALRRGNGVVIVDTVVNRGSQNEYKHMIVVREVRGNEVLINDPLSGPAVAQINESGFGRYWCPGDAVVASPR